MSARCLNYNVNFFEDNIYRFYSNLGRSLINHANNGSSVGPLVHCRCRRSMHRQNVTRFLYARCLRKRTVLNSTLPARMFAQGTTEEITDTSADTSKAVKISFPMTEGNSDCVTVDYWRGFPRITVPLPSRKEKCKFILKPVSNTVGDFINMLKQEDKGIDRAVLLTKDGVRIASSTTVELLMQEEEFLLTLNDLHYVVKVPTTYSRIFTTKDNLEKLSDVRNLVHQLYETLDIKEFQVHKEKELVAKLEDIRIKLKPLELKRDELERKASIRTSALTWVGLGMMAVQFGILARLTWWEYSWDIMEPVTYFVTYGTAMAMYAYFAITRQDYVLPDVRDRQYLITLHKKARKVGFDLDQYNMLRDQLAHVQQDLMKLRDPLYHPHRPTEYNVNSQSYGQSHVDDNASLDLFKNVASIILDKAKKKLKQG